MNQKNIRKVCVFLGSRAHYSSLISIMEHIQKSDKLEQILIVGASAILDKYGEAINIIERDGFKVNEKLFMIIEGENPQTMAKSTGLGLIELSSIFNKYKPNFTVIVADRFEMLACAIASAYNNIPIAHIQGGEVSGSIDESIRHAITKLSHLHFPSNELAKQRILQMGEDERYVFNFGCPRIDTVKKILDQPYRFDEINNIIRTQGVGDVFDINNHFLLIAQHPVTTEYGEGKQQITNTLQAIKEITQERDIPAIILWPNADAGSDDIAEGIRYFREHEEEKNLHFIKNFSFEHYIWLMDKTLCLIGNSSSGIREGGFIGTPVVNIGTRQNDRARASNVLDCDYSYENIKESIEKQITHGKYKSETIYGDGNAGKNIIRILETIDIKVQKRFMTRNISNI
ncbi:MAG: UDP-N-acetylglucosamine 2-epimerase [Promethearchaeota archaeon]